MAITPPPEAFTYKVIKCPSCAHGIDPHGFDPGGPCGVGDEHGRPCRCFWTPNDIAAFRIGRYNLDEVKV
jgi:hypothetical protein